MGGPDKVERQHAAGRLTVRERIDGAARPGLVPEIGRSRATRRYDETGALQVHDPDELRVRPRPDRRPARRRRGRRLHGARRRLRRVDHREAGRRGADGARAAAADGAPGRGQRRRRLGEVARGARLHLRAVPAGLGAHGAANLATVPVVSLGLGPVAGFGAAKVVASHYSLLVRGQSQMFVAGTAGGRGGGAERHEGRARQQPHPRANGAVDDEVESEHEAFERTRRFLSYLPSSVHELPPRGPQRRRSRAARRVRWSRPCRATGARCIACGRSSRRSSTPARFFEIGRLHGRCVITGLARLDGWPVAVVASDPFVGRRAVDRGELGEARALRQLRPDLPPAGRAPGRQPGLQRSASRPSTRRTIRAGARALTAIYQATVPWCTVIIRKVFGVAGAGHQNHTRFHYRYAWPSADWGSLPIEGGIEAAYKAELERRDGSRGTGGRDHASGSTCCARRSARPSSSRSRRSSTRATRGGCCASSRRSRRRCAPRVRCSSRIARDAAVHADPSAGNAVAAPAPRQCFRGESCR